MEIEPLDLADESTYDAFHALYTRAHPQPFDEPWSHLEKRSNLTSDTYAEHVVLVGRDDGGHVVAGAWLSLPQLDNVEKAYLQVFVDPAARRSGHGTAMLGHVERLAAEHDRTVAYAEVAWDVDDDAAPGVAFARARGYEVDLLNAVRFLDLPADVPDAPFRDGYTSLAWRECPDDLLDAYAELRAQMMAHAPSGDVGIEPEFFDATRVRSEEDRWQAQGRLAQTVAALSPYGELVGHTQLVVPSGGEAVYQWDTLVLPEHRGHGLGLALKTAALDGASDLLDGRTRVSTWNAASNAPMIAINDALGYRQVAWAAEMVRHLA